MINDIITGIAIKLDADFDLPVYTEDVPQNLNNGFHVSLISQNKQQYLLDRCNLRNLFQVVYFPAERNNRNELSDVSAKLMASLRMIQLADGAYLHGTDIDINVSDGTLVCTVNYNVIANISVGTADKMQSQTTSVSTEEQHG